MVSLCLGAITQAVVPLIHKVYMLILGVKPVGRSGSIICVELQHYKGCAVKLMDGSEVSSGDRVIKLHFDPAWFREKQRSSLKLQLSNPLGLLRYFKTDFSLLAAQVADGRYGEVTALYGWTVLHTPARRLGFQVTDLPNTLRIRLTQCYITALMHTYHIRWSGSYQLFRRPLQVKAVWLSRAELLRLYGPHS